MRRKTRNSSGELYDKASILSDLIEDYTAGNLYEQRKLFKVLVLEIDAEGGKFSENNPRKAIRGKIISDGRDEMTHEKDADVFWPLLSEHKSMPIKCGEAVWCIYDDAEMKSGWWMWRARDDRPEMLGLDDRAEINRSAVKDTPHYKEPESIPLFKSRPDDNTLLGDAGQFIRLGRDRTGEMDSGNESPVIDIVVGPEGENVDFEKDSARIFLARSSNNDIEGLEDRPVVFVQSDNVIFVARENLRLKIKDSETYVDLNKDGAIVNSREIKVGENAIEKLVKGDSLKALLKEHGTKLTVALSALAGIVDGLVPSGAGTTAVQSAGSLTIDIGDALSNKHKVE